MATRLLALCALGLCSLPLAVADTLDALASDFWKWRAVNQPFTGDDIPRIERPPEALPDWSTAAVARRRTAYAAFLKRWRALANPADPIPKHGDYRLIGSAIARVNWELNVTRNWQRHPGFYLEQTLGAVFESLLTPPPFTSARASLVIARLRRIPAVLDQAKANLTEMRRPFAASAVAELRDVRPALDKMARELRPHLPPPQAAQLEPAARDAAMAVEAYRAWLEPKVASLPRDTAIGRDNYLLFLHTVGLVPFTPEEMLLLGRQEWERSVAFEAYEQNRNRKLPRLRLFKDQAEQMAREEHDENAIRRFMEEHDILTVPAWMQHYRNLPLPPYLAAIRMGVTDDLTGPSRLKENGISYIQPPAPDLPYFSLSTARDPRPIIVHEGVPGHYFQLALSWAHEDPIRRFYYDSGANEGIGFYAEEMMLQAGLFDDSPRTREIIYNFMRLRALRVEVDVKLALGRFTIAQAADYLARTVPMDRRTAEDEASSFAALPGQAITYQIGKIQIQRMLADARRAQGDQFSLRRFHDFVWKNGNVPLSLQRWEMLKDPSEVPALAVR